MTSTSFAPRASDPPPIPGVAVELWKHPGHTLLWVRTGRMYVRLDDTPSIELTAGEGVWIPPTSARKHGVVTTEPGTVAFPLWLHADTGAGAVVEPTRFDVLDSWQDWLIQHFNLLVTPLTGRGYSHDGLIDLLRRPDTRRTTDAHPASTPFSTSEPPPMPRTTAARRVAEELFRSPALDFTVEDWAARVLCSPRTLRRDFRSGTDLTFEQWRLRCRLTAAVEFLIAGHDADLVASRVGFASPNGFARAFRRQFGSTPHEFRRERSTPSDVPRRAAAARQGDDLVHMMRGASATSDPPRVIPAARTDSHANDLHVLSWVYRGSGYLQIGDRTYERQRGDATWIPAGQEHTTGLHANSVSLPVGNASTSDLRLTEPLRTQFSPAWDDYLMFYSVSSRSWLRPDGHDPARILDLFDEQIAAQRALWVPMPNTQRARAAATNFLRTIATSDRSANYDLPAEVHRAFRDETGMTFASWRYATRMRVARELLAGGARPSAVSRRVGYAHLPNFSAAFSRFHGLSPREYQERETDAV